MRIGLMLRSLDEKGGIGVYSYNLVRELLRIDRKNHYILYYRNQANMGRFSNYSNVTERLVSGSNKLVWDQFAIPLACRHEKIDVIFHPKFTAPLLAPCKAVMVLHGADWFNPEQARYYAKLDVLYMRTLMPLYLKKCSKVISVSKLTTENFNQVFALQPGKIKTIYFGPARNFHRITDIAELERVKLRYNLSSKFIFTLTKKGGEERKNLSQLLQAYGLYHEQAVVPYQLLIGGLDEQMFLPEYKNQANGASADIICTGWIEQEDLPAIYSQTALYLYPSNLEAFPIPIAEAMACGTPIITSNVNGLHEIAGDAALLVDPKNPRAISDAIVQLLSSPELRRNLSRKALERSNRYSWEACAKETLSLLESLV
jgi:glycosyltransferase involved in cell wall biosynthesis